MNPNNPNNLNNPDTSHNNPIAAMREGEVVICSIKRHPIGIIGIFASFLFLLVVVGVVAVIAPDILSSNSGMSRNTISQIGMGIFLISIVFVALFSLIAQIVYFGNRWILTSDSLTQVVQNSLFSKQTSQLSLANLEDVTVVQDGILTHMFNYGVLKAETAGEHSKFHFPYCPNPNMYAQKILVARENFEQGQWYGEQRPDHRAGEQSQPPAPTPSA